MLFLIQRPCVVNEGAESADHKLNSMDSVLVDIENVVIMWVLEPIAIWFIWNRANMIRFSRLNTLATKAATLTNLDQPVLAYKRWCRDTLYNNSGLN